MIKKILLFFVVSAFIPCIAKAAPVGNIAKPAMLKSAMISPDDEEAGWGIIAEGEYDMTFDRNLKDQEGDTEFNFYGGKVGLLLYDRLIIYGLFGGANYEEEYTDEGSTVKFESEDDYAWGVGGMLLLYETQLNQFDDATLRFGLDGKYRSTKLDIDKIILDGTTYELSSSDVVDASLEYADWQVALAASLQWNQFVPYVGVKYSDLDATAKTTILGTMYEDDSAEADENLGVFVGLDVILLESVSLNVEGRFIDEEAISVGGSIRF